MTQIQSKPVRLVDEGREALQAIRIALIELYAVSGASPTEPQEVARRFGINRNLAWKLSKILNSADPFATLNHLPGVQGVESALRSFKLAGAPDEALARVSAALQQLTTVIERHARDREHFELMLESMGLHEREARAESGRELAFRGNSMIWGVSARVRMTLMILGPEVNGRADAAVIAGLVGFQRLRPSVRWKLLHAQMSDDEGHNLFETPGVEDVETGATTQPRMLLREFCSPNMPELESVSVADGREFYLPAGEIGIMAAFDCYTGYVYRGLPMRRAPGNDYASVASTVTLPAELLIQDALTHRSLNVPRSPDVLTYGFPHGGPDNPTLQTPQNRLPITEPAVQLPGPPPVVATPLVPRYSQLVSRLFQRLGWDPAEFDGLRVQMKYPPMNSRVVTRWPLPG